VFAGTLRSFPIAIILGFLLLGSSNNPVEEPDEKVESLAFADDLIWVDTNNKDEVLAFFESNFDEIAAPVSWTGSHSECEAGVSSQLLRDQTISRVNFYRAMAGVPAEITEEFVYSGKAQHGALTMSAQGELSHEPDETYECLNDFGKEAAANSNLYLGRTGSNAIDGYIEDPGVGNKDVGHRSTVLHPPTLKMGVGHTQGSENVYESNVLWVFDDNVFQDWPEMREDEQFVAWPPRGFVPQEIVYPRWSFSLKDGDFSEATVSMVDDSGQQIELDIVATVNEIGQVPSPIIVWEPDLSLGTGTYDIEVSNVETAEGVKDFLYEVTII